MKLVQNGPDGGSMENPVQKFLERKMVKIFHLRYVDTGSIRLGKW